MPNLRIKSYHICNALFHPSNTSNGSSSHSVSICFGVLDIWICWVCIVVADSSDERSCWRSDYASIMCVSSSSSSSSPSPTQYMWRLYVNARSMCCGSWLCWRQEGRVQILIVYFRFFACGSEPDQTWTYNSWPRHCPRHPKHIDTSRLRLNRDRAMTRIWSRARRVFYLAFWPTRRTSLVAQSQPSYACVFMWRVCFCVCCVLCAAFLLRGSRKWLSKMRQTQNQLYIYIYILEWRKDVRLLS